MRTQGRFGPRLRVPLLALLAATATLVSGCGAPKAQAKPQLASWQGASLLRTLARQPNYADTASVRELNFDHDLSYAQDATHRGKDYLEDVLGGARSQAFMGATSIAYVGTRYYINVTAPPAGSGLRAGWYDLGESAQGVYASVLRNYAQIGSALEEMLKGSTAKQTGSCTVLGRKGRAWDVKFLLPQGSGPSKYASGTACTDQRTGAPLTINVSYTATDSQGKEVLFSGHFRMTSFGSVPRLQAPTGASPAPKLNYAP